VSSTLGKIDDDYGTYFKSTSTGCWLVWNKEQGTKKDVPMDPKGNMTTFLTVPGTFNYHTFEANFTAYDASTPHIGHRLTYDQVQRGALSTLRVPYH
jgi:hypothetical protein